MAEPLRVTIASAKGLIQSESKRFQAALTSDPAIGRIRPVSFEPWYAAVISDFERQPKLIEAAVQAPDTVLDCLTVAANCGLVPGGPHGKFYLIPRWNGKRQAMTCTFIIGYKGLAEMAYRHQRVHRLQGVLIYKGEPFEYEPGSSHFMHKWLPDVDRSEEQVVAAYSRVVLTVPGGTHVDQQPLIHIMTRAELLAARDRSEGWRAFKAGKIQSTPWSTDPAAMMRKTPMRRHYGGGEVPQSADLIVGMAAETAHEERLENDAANPTAVAAATASGGLRAAIGLEPVAESITLPPKGEPAGDPIDRDFEAEARRMEREE